MGGGIICECGIVVGCWLIWATLRLLLLLNRLLLLLTRFTLGGNSMGGGVAWRYALKHGDKVERLILIDAAGSSPAGRWLLQFRNEI